MLTFAQWRSSRASLCRQILTLSMEAKALPALSKMVTLMNSKHCNAMKKIFTRLMLWAVAATAFVSCENNLEDATVGGELTQTVTLSAEKPAEVRTELIEGVPYWSKGDKIGVYTTEKNLENEYYLTNDSKEATLTTTFTGTTALSETIFVFYPSKGYGTNLESGAKTEIPAIQKPTATSFDGAADIMFAKPVTLDAQGKQLSNLEFARVGAIVKIVLKDNTGNLANQHLSALTMTAATNLTGRVYLDVVNQKLGELYYSQAKSVTAEYTEATQYAVNGENATYVIVYPQTLKSGSKLSFEGATEGYAISKEITLAEDIALESGKVTTLNVSLAAANVVKEETGLALPFEDDFSWVKTTSTTAYSSITSVFPKKDGAAMYSAVSYVYPETKQVKFGSGSSRGYLTTSELNLSKPFSVIVSAKRYNTDTAQLKVTAGGVEQTSANLGADYATYVFKFDAVGSKEKVRFDITGKRGYINNITIIEGHVLPPVLTVSPETLTFESAAASKTVTCTIENEVDGVNVTATESVDWISTSVSGKTVTIAVTENSGDARTATVTIAYEGAKSKTVSVSQDAAAGVEAKPVTVTMKSFSAISASMDSVISYACAKGGGTSNPAVNSNQIRLYQGNPGGNITITAKAGHTITSVVIGSAMKTSVAYQVDGGSRSSSASLSANGKYTINQEGQSITIHCMGSDKNSRLYVNYLSVTYK